MEIRLHDNRTAEGVRQAIQTAMDINRRKRVFHAVGNIETGELAVAPESDFINAFGDDWAGLCGIRRERWAGVPGYADRVVCSLLGVLQGNKMACL